MFEHIVGYLLASWVDKDCVTTVLFVQFCAFEKKTIHGNDHISESENNHISKPKNKHISIVYWTLFYYFLTKFFDDCDLLSTTVEVPFLCAWLLCAYVTPFGM